MIHGAAGGAVTVIIHDTGGVWLAGDGKGGLVNEPFFPKSLEINDQFGIRTGVIRLPLTHEVSDEVGTGELDGGKE